MRQKLFTKEIDNKLFAQYKYGSDLSKQMVVAKIFNPYNNGVWFIINSDPNDPDYLWAIVDLFEIEAGSVSREDLQTIKVPPFGLNLERDLYFQPINAQELYDRLRQGERFEHGGSVDVIQNDKDESYLTSVNAKPTDAAIKLADGGEIAKSFTVMYFKEGKNRFGEKIESAFNNTRVQGTLKEAIEKVKEELVGNISYATIKDRSIGDVLIAKVKQDGTINIYREGYGIDKMAKGGTTKNYTYVPKSDIKGIDAVIGGKEQKISGKDVLDGAYVKKSVPKVDKEEKYKVQVNQYIPYKSNKGVSYYYVSDSKNIINKNTGKIYRGKEMNNYKFSTENEAQKFADKLNNEGENKSVPKSNKGKLSERAQILLDSTMESFERQNDRQRAASIKQVEDNLAANKKGIDNIGMGLDEDMVAAGEEFIKKVKSKEYIKAYKNKTFDYSQGQLNLKAKKLAEDKGISYEDLSNPEYRIQLCQAFVAALTDANFHSEAKKFVADLEKEKWSDKLYKSKYYDASDTVREFGVSVSQMSSYEGDRIAEVFIFLFRMNGNQNLADSIEDLFAKYAKGGVTFKDKVKSISNSLNGKKVPSKLKKDYGATYDKKESVLAATRIAGAMKAKMENKKKR